MSRNVDVVLEIHTCFNQRRWDDLVADLAADFLYTNESGEDLHGPGAFAAEAKGWTDAFSDCRITEARYYDAGDVVVTEYVGLGTNDGPFLSMPPTGKPATMPYIEVYHFDRTGMITSMRGYCDLLGILTQLGVAPATVPAQSTTDVRGSEATRTSI